MGLFCAEPESHGLSVAEQMGLGMGRGQGDEGKGHTWLFAKHQIMPFLAPEHLRIWGFLRLRI